MLLVSQSLRSRAFLMQFIEVLQEFGGVIPWLDPLRSLRYITNTAHFRDKFLLSVCCKDESEIKPLQLVSSDRSHEYVGGIIHLAHSPEIFTDSRNQGMSELLAHEGYQFMTCLQVRTDRRNRGHGFDLFSRALRTILENHEKVWGVVSDPKLLSWYSSLGGEIRSPLDNQDCLWILSWENK
jgi:hypothetical protein